MSVTLEYRVDDAEVRQLLDQLGERARDLTTPMRLIGAQLQFSVQENFARGGRPLPWKPSKRAIAQGGQTLVDSRRLESSITSRTSADRVEIGTNVLYGPIHQFGFLGMVHIPAHVRLLTQGGFARRSTLSARTKSGRKKTQRIGTYVTVTAHERRMDMPARPYLVVQEEDHQRATETVRDYLLGLRGSR